MVPKLEMYPKLSKESKMETVRPAGIMASLPSAGSPLSQLPASAQSLLMAPVKLV